MVSEGGVPSCIITLSSDPVGKRVLILIGIKTLNSDSMIS